VRDCWHDTYVRAPIDGTAWVNPGCDQYVIRGGYWASSPDQTRSAYRLYAKPNHHDARIGIRIARDL
jgi:formylglycine-generating enzyme required for sulfatase activity